MIGVGLVGIVKPVGSLALFAIREWRGCGPRGTANRGVGKGVVDIGN